MKKSNLLRLLWAVLVVMLLPVGNSFGQEAYAVFEDGTLTLKYDNQRPDDAYDIRSSYSNGWANIASNINQVVFDASFKEYPATSCAYWFYACYNLTEIVGMKDNLNTANVTDMSCMFAYCSKLSTLDLSKFDTKQVTNMSSMFYHCSNLTSLNLSGFDTQNVTNMSYMFSNCSKLSSLDLSGFDTQNVTNMCAMFDNCSSLTSLDLSGFDTRNVIDMWGMFDNCSSLTSLDLSGFDTKKVTDMGCIFRDCSNLTSLDLSGFDTKSVLRMGSMFSGCSKLTSLDLSGFDTRNAKSMGAMFFDCSSLTSLDLSRYNTKKVTGMDNMFSGCSKLKTIFVGDYWTTDNVTSSNKMFYGCENLIGGKGTAYISQSTDKEYAIIDGGDPAPGYLTKIAPISIAIKTAPQTDYIEGDQLNITEGELLVTYDNNTTKTIALNKATLSGFDNTKIGEQTIKVSYIGLETEFKVTIVAKSPVSIAMSTLPIKVEYVENEEFNNTNGEILVTYNDETTEKVAVSKATISGFDNTKIGEQTIKVSYLGLETYFKVTVVAKSPISIAISTLPTKVEYSAREELDISGGELLVTYDNNTTKTIALNKATISGFDNTKIGEQTIKVSYLGLETDFKVTVVAKSPISIALSTLPTKVEYTVNEKFDVSGGELLVTYNNETTEKVALNKATLSGFDNTKIGEQTIKVSYIGLETSFKVSVIAKPIAIAIAYYPQLSYTEGDNLSTENGYLRVIYNNNKIDTIALEKAEILDFDNTKVGEQIIRVSYLGLETSLKVIVNKKDTTTPVSSISENNIKVWSFNHTIYIENAPADTKYTIIDINGRVIATSNTKYSKEEVNINKSGVVIVNIGNQSFKVSL